MESSVQLNSEIGLLPALAKVVKKALPPSAGDNSTVWFMVSQQRKYLLVGGETLKTKEACADYGPNVFNITMDGSAVIFRDDQCGRIVAQHSLGDRALYLHTAMTSLPKCRGALANMLPSETLPIRNGLSP